MDLEGSKIYVELYLQEFHHYLYEPNKLSMQCVLSRRLLPLRLDKFLLQVLMDEMQKDRSVLSQQTINKQFASMNA